MTSRVRFAEAMEQTSSHAGKPCGDGSHVAAPFWFAKRGPTSASDVETGGDARLRSFLVG